MSEILANIVVDQNNINFQPTTNNLNVTPEAINLNIYTAGSPGAGQSSNGELLFNNLNLVDGVPFTNYDGNKLTLGNASNIKITGGTNTYFLQTDGTGNLTWAAGAGNITGNGVPGGANTQIQFNDGGANFGGSAGFTFDKSSNVFSAPGDANIAGNIDIAGNANIAGSIVGVDANLGNVVTANYFIGTLYGTANVAVTANTAATVTTNSQPNITSLGTLTSLIVSGNISTTGTTSIQQAKEKVTSNNTGATGTVNFDVLTQAILLNTANATTNFILNIRGNSTVTLDSVMNSNESATIRFINTNGNTGYYANIIQIDGSNVTPLWTYPTGAPSAGISNGKDVYDFQIIKTAANTYTLFASRIGYQ